MFCYLIYNRTIDGNWHIFTGNEIGVMLGHYQIQKYLATRGTDNEGKAAVLTTVVSSRMLKGIADKEGIHYAATLTGNFIPYSCLYIMCYPYMCVDRVFNGIMNVYTLIY